MNVESHSDDKGRPVPVLLRGATPAAADTAVAGAVTARLPASVSARSDPGRREMRRAIAS